MQTNLNSTIFDSTCKDQPKHSVLSNEELPTSAIFRTDKIGNFKKPPIPEGYYHVGGTWNTGFTIRPYDGSYNNANFWTWLPIGALPENGTLDSKKFNTSLGRRNYFNDIFSLEEFHEEIDTELLETIQMIEEYGGIYISTYLISKDEDGMPCSVPKSSPWTNIEFKRTIQEASALGFKYTKSHLCYGAELDSLFEWLRINGKEFEVLKDSTSCGNYYNSDNSPRNLALTGSSPAINGFSDIGGNVRVRTTEKYNLIAHAIRGGYYFEFGNEKPISIRDYALDDFGMRSIGFRATLCMV